MTLDRKQHWLHGFEGVVSALVTPLDARGRVDTEAVHRLVELQLSSGVPAIMVGGTTGEFMAMDEEERRDVVALFVEATAGRAKVVANIGHVDYNKSIRLAEHATGVGVDAVAAITPYFLPFTEDSIESYLRNLSRSVPEMAVMGYHFPRNATNELTIATFGRLLEEPNFVGVKCSVGSLEEVLPFLEFRGEATIMSGNDELFNEFVSAGGRAVVSGNASVFPELIVMLFTQCLAGEWSDADSELMNDIASAGRHGAPDRLKELLRRRGVIGEFSHVVTHTKEDVRRDGNDAAAARVEKFLETLESKV